MEGIETQSDKLITLALEAGSGILRYGGETYRAEECVERIMKSANAEDIQVFAVPTSITACVKIGGVYLTRAVAVKERDIDLGMLDVINTVSRNVCSGTMTLEEAEEALSRGKSKKVNPYLLGLYSTVFSASLAVVFGGGPIDFLLSFISAGVTNICLRFFKKTTRHTFLSALFGSLVMAATAKLCCSLVPGASLSSVITGGIMPMVPGTAITNAVRDSINGDLVSGASRTLEALVQAVAVAAGVSVVLMIGG